jgi:dihydrodipicolinate synthase/N-acetylneuraminate lyase
VNNPNPPKETPTPPKEKEKEKEKEKQKEAAPSRASEAPTFGAGVFAALPTPFDERRLIDSKALDHLVDYLLQRRLAGLALLTEAAEDPLLALDERRALVKTIGSRVKGRKPMLMAVSTPATYEALELVKLGEANGVTGVILTTPRVPGIGYKELYRHLDRLIRGTKLPITIAVRPGNMLRSLLPEELDALMGHASLRGCFVPQVSVGGIESWAKRWKGKNNAVLAGSSLALSRAVKAGATGAVCAMAVIASEQAAQLWAAISGGKQDAIDKLESRLSTVHEYLSPPIPAETKEGVQKLATKIAKRPLEGATLLPMFPFAHIKEALRLQGHPIRPDVRPPYESLRPEASERLKAILQRGGVLS